VSTFKERKKYGLLPTKKAEVDPWVTVCVDLIGPFTIIKENFWCKFWIIFIYMMYLPMNYVGEDARVKDNELYT
jgi:hypothetical protein